MKIADRLIGPGEPVYVIAEISGNHGHELEKARQLIRAAKVGGADAVKLQTYTADTITLKSDADCFKIKGTIFAGRTLHDLYAEACTPWEWQGELKALAESLGMHCFSSPFDATAVDFLETLNVPAYKIASFELVDLPLIEKVARTGKPLILSTGMGSFAEIDEAVQAAREAGASEIALLKCTSAVPAPLEEMNLRAIPELQKRFGVHCGLSDHSPGIVAPVAAVTLGATIIEKHIKLDGDNSSPDCAFSLTATEFKQMVEAVRQTEQVLGDGIWRPVASDQSSLQFRRSLFVKRDIRQGEPLSEENIGSFRPAAGLAPKHLKRVLGLRAKNDLKAGTPLNWDMMEEK